jgi:hypothetical protein
MPPSSPLHHRNCAKLVEVKLVVVDRREVVVLRFQWTNTTEQQATVMIRTVSVKPMSTLTNTKTDRIPGDQSDIKLYAPFAGTRCTTRARIGWG